MESSPLLVIGNPTIDLNVVFGRSAGPRLGGTGAITALSLAKFGNRVVMVGRVGRDLGDLLSPLARAGVEVIPLPAESTLRFENVYPDPRRPDRREQKARAVPAPIGPEDLKAVLRRRFCGVLLGPLTPSDLSLDVLRAVRQPDRPVALDVQGFLREVNPDGSVRPRAWKEAADSLAGLALLHAGDDEAAALLGEKEAGPGSAERLARGLGVETVAVTRGGDGAWIWSGEGLSEVPAYEPGLRMEDPTGCGDIFLAALFHARLQGWPAARAGRFAAMAAALNAYSPQLYCASAGDVERALLEAKP
jgi:sugar/nucleoside kinase (ribokinase family)